MKIQRKRKKWNRSKRASCKRSVSPILTCRCRPTKP
ncbi:Cation transport protein chaC [Caballeronia sordidicola]|uniref:Cation transport protein chaC n=1 Tax=Caballeronia sordidicola TaxID=196367 RepID=A0A226WX08_CABSO|nr:Cation transport protein chaC [Caballeronia sordidicola]